jgi:hypothetical protein
LLYQAIEAALRIILAAARLVVKNFNERPQHLLFVLNKAILDFALEPVSFEELFSFGVVSLLDFHVDLVHNLSVLSPLSSQMLLIDREETPILGYFDKCFSVFIAVLMN